MTIDRDLARERAREILSGGHFRRVRITTQPRRPTWIDRNLTGPIGRFVASVFRAVSSFLVSLPGMIVAAAAVLLACAWIASKVIATRANDESTRDAVDVSSAISPEQLELDAADAERRGDFAAAVRLRFRAGLGRLQRTGVVDNRPSVTTAQVGRRLRSPKFDGLARTFDDVAYGSGAAGAGDAAMAREQWPKVLEDAPR